MAVSWTKTTIGAIAEVTDYVANGSFATLRENVHYKNEEDYAVLVRLADYTNNFDKSKFVYIDEHAYNFLAKSRLEGGEIIMSNVGSIGKLFICPVLDKPMSLAPNSILIRTPYNKFFYYLLSSHHYQAAIKGISSQTALPKFNKTEFKKITVSIPDINEQKRIVEELDLLTGIIDKKNAQLRDLDALAQSIFYEMFGDPVTNEKGWPTAQLSSVSTLLNGRAYKQDELLNTGKYRVLRVGNFFTNSNYYYSDLELEDDKYCDNGDLLFAWSASFGAFIWSGEKVIYHYHIWKVLFDNARLNKEFYRFLLNTMTSSFLNDVHGIGMVHLTKAGMEQYVLPIPPMEKQEEFANKIASIEKQRTVMQASLDGANQLLTSRMSFYFE